MLYTLFIFNVYFQYNIKLIIIYFNVFSFYL